MTVRCVAGQGENEGDPWGGEREGVRKVQSIFIPTLGTVVQPWPFVDRLHLFAGVGIDIPHDFTRHMYFDGL